MPGGRQSFDDRMEIMNSIYRVTVHGRILESRDLRKLLARAVAEKRSMDKHLRLFGSMAGGAFSRAAASPGIMCSSQAGSR
jgi:hypothetical protein